MQRYKDEKADIVVNLKGTLRQLNSRIKDKEDFINELINPSGTITQSEVLDEIASRNAEVASIINRFVKNHKNKKGWTDLSEDLWMQKLGAAKIRMIELEIEKDRILNMANLQFKVDKTRLPPISNRRLERIDQVQDQARQLLDSITRNKTEISPGLFVYESMQEAQDRLRAPANTKRRVQIAPGLYRIEDMNPQRQTQQVVRPQEENIFAQLGTTRSEPKENKFRPSSKWIKKKTEKQKEFEEQHPVTKKFKPSDSDDPNLWRN
jgi:hypothetical protein